MMRSGFVGRARSVVSMAATSFSKSAAAARSLPVRHPAFDALVKEACRWIDLYAIELIAIKP